MDFLNSVSLNEMDPIVDSVSQGDFSVSSNNIVYNFYYPEPQTVSIQEEVSTLHNIDDIYNQLNILTGIILLMLSWLYLKKIAAKLNTRGKAI